jgi:hypothetical protein
MKYYAGIGSRTIPDDISKTMTSIAGKLECMGYTLRSGNAEGADQAFAKGVKGCDAQIWLPWNNFNKKFKDSHPQHTYRILSDYDEEAFKSVVKFHPRGSYIINKEGKPNVPDGYFHARNYRQICGYVNNEPDSSFVICWTHDGTDVGGTGQAMRIAKSRNIPIYNLYHLSEDDVMKEINKLELIS